MRHSPASASAGQPCHPKSSLSGPIWTCACTRYWRACRPLCAEGSAIIDAYSGRAGEFYRLFYLPVWSFLHWIPASADIALDPVLVDDARTAQALGLFLHLWDDHLCDGQLSTDLLRLQIRTEAWHAYLDANNRLRARIAPGSQIVEEHVATYLAAIHLKEPVTDIAAYCSRFTRQIAIWTLVPQLLGRAGGGPSVAANLSLIVEAFSNAWRLIDDVQDVEDDIQAGVESAVWQCLDDAGRAAWAECRAAPLAQGGLEPQSWATLFELIQAPGCIPHLLVLTNDWLDQAARLAELHQWRGLASEILEHRSTLMPNQIDFPVVAANGDVVAYV